MENTGISKSKYKPIQSISDAEQRLINWNPDVESSADFPNFIINSLMDSIDKDKPDKPVIIGNSSQFHNLSSEFARKGLYKHAEQVAAIGVRRYKYNADLLADIVKFGADSQEWDACKKAYDRLCSIDFKKWTWRCFTFSIDYLLNYMEVSEPDEAETISTEIKGLISAYKELKDERAWVAEANLLLAEGLRSEAIASLKEGVENVAVSPQCCLKLADLLLEDGEYAEVIDYSAIGIRATAQDQPSASTAYLLYISALAKDALIHQEAQKLQVQKSEGINTDDHNLGFYNLTAVKDALLDYDTAKQLFRETRPIYVNNIIQREIILKAKSGIGSSDEDDIAKKKIAQNIMEQLLQKSSDQD